MRWIYLVLLLAIVTVIVAFIIENNEDTRFTLFNKGFSVPLSWFVIAVYFLGMWSGGTVVGFIKRAYYRATEPEEQKQA
jgi:uncharacterized integral membrane protein